MDVTVTTDMTLEWLLGSILLRWLSMPMDLLFLHNQKGGSLSKLLLLFCYKKYKEDIHFLSFYYSINETFSSINKKMDGTIFKSYINHFHIQLYVSCDHISGDKGHVISTKWITIKIKPGQNPHITWYQITTQGCCHCI